jgi:hypothetical protein
LKSVNATTESARSSVRSAVWHDATSYISGTDYHFAYGEHKTKVLRCRMDEGRKRVIGIMAAILTSLHMQTADDLFGGPQGSPRTDTLIAASVQWAEAIMRKIDSVCSR